VIAEVIPGFYDFEGKRISRPSKKRHPSFEGRPMGSFLSQPLKVVCRDMDEIRAFLSTCRYVSDWEQFGLKDHWMAPEEFEKTRRGDCDDFALWTWRQLLGLGYDARFVVGGAGRYGAGHAWVSYRVHDQIFIMESLLSRYKKFPRLETLRYRPSISVEASGSQTKFFEHQKRTLEPPLRIIVPLVFEWVVFQIRALSGWLLRPSYVVRRLYRRISGKPSKWARPDRSQPEVQRKNRV
jgi:Bacterial transglutaminase-like cysteine proteinase BTLCP